MTNNKLTLKITPASKETQNYFSEQTKRATGFLFFLLEYD